VADQSFNILINGRSGTVLNMGRDAIESAIAHSGIKVAELCFAEPDTMQAETDRLIALDAPLLIGGGTARCVKALSIFLRRKSRLAYCLSAP